MTEHPALSPSDGFAASVASSGDAWLAVYGVQYGKANARRLGSDGTPIGAPLQLGTQDQYYDLSVAFDGNAFVVAWLSGEEPYMSINFQRISADGMLLGAPLAVGSFASAGLSLIGYDGGVLALACSTRQVDNHCQAWSFDSSGKLIGADKVTVPSGISTMTSTRSDDDVLTVFDDGVGRLSVLRTATDATFLDDGPIAIASGHNVERAPGVVGTPNGFAIVWSSDGDEQLTTVDHQGAVVTRPSPLYSGQSFGLVAAIATSDGAALVARDCPDCAATLRRFSFTWQPLGAPITVNQEPEGYTVELSTSASGSDVMAFWSSNGLENGTQEPQAVARLLDLAHLDVERPVIPVSVAYQSQVTPLSAAGGDGWLIAWAEWYAIGAQIIDRTGQPQGAPFRLGNGKQFAYPKLDAVAGTPNGWLVIWEGSLGAHASLVSPSGSVLEQDLDTPPTEYRALGSASGFFFGYENRDAQGFYKSVACRELDSEAHLLHKESLSDISTDRLPFDVTPLDDGFRVWWTAGGKVLAKDVRGDQVTVGPELRSPFNYNGNPELRATPSALLACQNQRCAFAPTRTGKWAYIEQVLPSAMVESGSTTAVALADAEGSHSFGIRVAEDGTLVEADRIEQADDPALALGTDGRALLTFTRTEEIDGASALRSYMSFVSFEEASMGGAGAGGSAGNGEAGNAGDAGSSSGGDAETLAGEGGIGGESAGAATTGGRNAIMAFPRPRHTHSDISDARFSQACGCRVAGTTRGGSEFAALLLLAWRLRRRASKAVALGRC